MRKMKRCVIIGGAEIQAYAYIRSCLREDDFLVFCDSGLRHMEALEAKPDLIVGDFDSHCNPHLDVETIVLPHEKDDTDTMYAVKEMVKRGCDEFLLLGVIGARLDHTLGNVAILLYLDSLGKRASILDDYSEMEIVSRKPVQIDERYEFFSLLNISGIAKGIDIENAKYPLRDATVTRAGMITISNEAAANEIVTVEIRDGRALVVFSRDFDRAL